MAVAEQTVTPTTELTEDQLLMPVRNAVEAYEQRETAPAQEAEFSGPRECGHWRS